VSGETPAPVTDPAASAPPPGGGPVFSPEARRLAGTILEVLAGMTSITDAAIALGITAARYQVLETRAVLGLIAACEPRPPGPTAGASLPGDLERLRAERDRLTAEVARYQTLHRIAQQAFGTQAEPLPGTLAELPGARRRHAERGGGRQRSAPVPATTASGRKKRTPTVRALRLAKRVREVAPGPLPPPGSTAAPRHGTPDLSAGG
jgi:hypothetical protein